MRPFNLLILYLIVYFLQPGARIPALSSFQLEKMIGLFWLLNYLYYKKEKKEDNSFSLENRILKLALALFILILALLPIAIVKSYCINVLITLLKHLVLFAMIAYSLESKEDYRKVFYCIVTLVTFISGEALIKGNYDMNGRLCGITGNWDSPNDLGGLLSSTLTLAGGVYFGEKRVRNKVLVSILASVLLLGIVKTYSRTAFLAVIAYFFIIWTRSKYKIITLLIMVFCLIGVFHYASPNLKQRIISISYATDPNRRDGSESKRLQLFIDGINLFLAKPWGYGADNFVAARGRRFNRWQPAHCLYTQVLVDLGIEGFILMSVFWITIYRIFSGAKKLAEKDVILRNLLLAGRDYLIIRLFIGILAYNLYTNYWWIAAGLAIAGEKCAHKPQ